MRKVVLYIAMSLDGYIADSSGGVGWLSGQGEETGEDGYTHFIQQVDTVILGWNTYHQIVTELSPEQWVYQGLTSYVLTHRAMPSTPSIRFVAEEPCSLVERLRRQPGKDIWICGGSGVIQPLIRAGLIEEYIISVIPTLLGSGLHLFGETGGEVKLKLLQAKSSNGIVELRYIPR